MSEFAWSNTKEEDNSFIVKAMVLSFVVHATLLAFKYTFPMHKVDEPKQEAIKVTFVDPAEVLKKNKVIKTVADFKEPEKVKEIPKEKVVSGTKKVIPKAKSLGNPDAKVVQKVQKGDPVSQNMTKYKPGTEFRKLESTNIGTGSGAKFEGAKLGGGSGDTYKGLDFATKSLTGRLGHRFSAKSAADDFGAGAGKGGGIGDGVGKGFGDGTITGTSTGTLQTAKILNNVGSLTGATVGTIGSSKGSEGLSAKGSIVLSGSPDETVILGSMDPNVIRRILLDHLAQFRFCYQNELESNSRPDELAGVVHLNFNIGPGGNVSKTAVGGDQKITRQVKNCVAGVLAGISFPAPKGGGEVEVKQPMNFYPKKI